MVCPDQTRSSHSEQSTAEEPAEDDDVDSLIDSLRRVHIKSVARLPLRWIIPGALHEDNITLSERGLKA